MAALAPALVVGGCDRQRAADKQPAAQTAAAMPTGGVDRSHRGSLLPELQLKDTAGREKPLTAFRGKPFLLNLWATWCAPCLAELPALAGLKSAGTVEVVAVSQDLRGPDKVTHFLGERSRGALQPWYDPENAFSTQYAVQTLPTTIYYDAQGREVWRILGEHDWQAPETAKLLAEAR